MFFSLIYICCCFQGGILSVVFRTVATCFWPAGNLECPCLFSDLILFPFLLLFSYIVPYPSFSSMSFSLIYICCSLIIFLFSSFSSILFLTLPVLLCLFHWSISAVVSGEAFYLLFSLLYPYVSGPQGTWSALVSFPTLSSSLFSSFSSILFLTLPFLLCLFHWSITAVVSGKAFYLLIICCFPHCSHMFLARREPGVPLSLFRPYPLPFSPSFFLYCSLPFPFSLTYICCSFRGGILSADYLLFSPL